MPIPLIAAGIGAIGSAVGGAFSNNGSSTQLPVLPGASQLQGQLQGGLGAQYSGLQNYMNPNSGDLSSGTAQSNYGGSVGAFSQALQNYAQGGGMPNAQQIAAGQTSAQAQFAPQQQALQQQFYYQNQSNAQQEALLGRGPTDPILQAKLAQSQGFQQQQLTAQQGAYGNQLAMQMPQNQLNAMGQQNQLLGNVYQQALSNQQYLLSTGSQLLGQQYSYQLGAGGRQTNTSLGGGVAGGIAGGIAGMGALGNAYAQNGYQYTPAGGGNQNGTQIGPWAGGYGAGSQSQGYYGGRF